MLRTRFCVANWKMNFNSTDMGSFLENWNNKDSIDFYYAKGEITHLLETLGVKNIAFKERDDSSFDISCYIYAGKNILGIIGAPSEDSKSKFSIKGDLFFSELDISSILKSISKKDNKVSGWNYFPFINRDISIIISRDINFSALEKLILSIDNSILKSVIMFDLYEDDKLDENEKSMSFRMKFQSEKRTLKDDEVDVIVNKVISGLKEKFNAVQR